MTVATLVPIEQKIDDYLAFGAGNIRMIDPGRWRVTVWATVDQSPEEQ